MGKKISLRAKRIAQELESLESIGMSKCDKNNYYFYFPQNDNGGIYGFKINKISADISAVMYVSDFWDIDIELEDLFNNISEETANAIIFNLDIIMGNVK